MRNFLLALVMIIMTSMTAYANNVKDSDVHTVTGAYIGWFSSEEGMNVACVKPSGKDEFCVGASEEEAAKAFGTTKGAQVQMKFTIKTINGNMYASMVGGSVIGNKSANKSSSGQGQLAAYLLNNGIAKFYECDGQGTGIASCTSYNGMEGYMTFKKGDASSGKGSIAGYRDSDESFTWKNNGVELEVKTRGGQTYRYHIVDGRYLVDNGANTVFVFVPEKK